MQNVDELCIKYVLNELDPSEIQLVEEAMANDDNILIEIESLRSTLRRLENLPKVQSPQLLQDKIKKLAEAETEKKALIARHTKIRYAGFLAAAVVTLALGTGFIYTWITGATPQVEDAQSAFIQPVEQISDENQAVHAATVQFAQPSLIEANQNVEQLEPWVDNHNMLRINVVNNAAGFSIAAPGEYEAKRELRPVDPTQVNSSYPMLRDIQLTRTQN